MSSRLAEVWNQPELRTIVAAVHPMKLFLVGGAVRDLLLDRPVKDFDFLVDCSPQELLALKDRIKERTESTVIVLDRERGILRVCHQRTEGLDLAARQGDTVEKDLERRDVTFNALALSSEGDLLDPFGGETDLKNGLVRATSEKVLHSDPLRVLRCLRLAADLGFQIEPETSGYLRGAASGLSQIAGERIGEELARFLSHAAADHARDFRRSGAAEAIWSTDLPWDWLLQWWDARPHSEHTPRPKDTVLSILAAMLEPENAQNGESHAERIKMSRSQTRYLKAWWAGCASLQNPHPATAREIYALVKTAGQSLPGLLEFTVLPAFSRPLAPELAQRIHGAALGEGELRWEPMPIGGEELCRLLERSPGPWLGEVVRELEAAWACREQRTKEELLAYSAAIFL